MAGRTRCHGYMLIFDISVNQELLPSSTLKDDSTFPETIKENCRRKDLPSIYLNL